MRNVGTWHESHSSPTHIQSVARESAPAPRISNYKRQARYFNDHTCTKIYITTAWDEDTYKEDIYKHCTKYDTMSMTTHILVHVQPLTVVLSFATCLRYHPERVDCMEGGGVGSATFLFAVKVFPKRNFFKLHHYFHSMKDPQLPSTSLPPHPRTPGAMEFRCSLPHILPPSTV